MSRRVYRNPGLSELSQRTYLRMHYGWSKREFTDFTSDLYNFCYEARVPFILLIQPRRFCTLELAMEPVGFQMTLPDQVQIGKWVEEALKRSPAPKRAKFVHIAPSGAMVRGLEPDDARQLAQLIWKRLAQLKEATA